MSITERIDNITLVRPEYQDPRPPCPESVKIELTGRCNYRCGFCALRARDKQPTRRDDMTLAEFQRIVTELLEAGITEVGLFYLGESLSAPALTIEACRWAKQEAGVPYVFLTTNGSLASPDVVERLFEAGLDSLKFSINAADMDEFEEIMGVKRKLYQDALANLRSAREIRDAGGYATKLYASSIRYDGEHQEKMQSLVDQYVRPWVDEWYELPLYSMGSVATEREAELGYRPTAGNQGRLGNLRKPLPCWSAFTEIHIRSDSSVSLCCFDADGRFVMGNMKDKPFMEIWHSDEFARIRQAHLDENLAGTVCQECVAY